MATARTNRALPPDMPVHYWAFCEQHHDLYHRYAALLVHDLDDAAQAVAAALADLAACWTAVLRDSRPAAAAWQIVKQRVHAVVTAQDCGRTPPGHQAGAQAAHHLSVGLDADQADVVLLTWGLELNQQQISDLTGLDTAAVGTWRRLAQPTASATPPPRAPHAISTPSALPLDFEAFITDWQEAYLAYALGLLHNSQQADQAVLQAALEIHRNWRPLLAAAAPAAQAFQILKKTLMAHRMPLLGMEHARGSGECSSADALDQSLDALERLSPVSADCIRLRHLAGLGYSQVAALLGFSPAMVRTQTWSALRLLQEQLDHSTSQQEPYR